MHQNVVFHSQALNCLVGGQSVLELKKLNVDRLETATSFLMAYGYDFNLKEDQDFLYKVYAQAITFIRTNLLYGSEKIPEEIADLTKLKDIRNLLVYASYGENKNMRLQRWSCAVLKVIHSLVHLSNDIFHLYPDKIKEQIIKPIKSVVYEDSLNGKVLLGKGLDSDTIQLEKFEVKPTKTVYSSVIKLLAKKEATTMSLLDTIGLRFITKDVFDAFRVIRYLVNTSLISFPNSMSDQSTNQLYPLNIFLESLDELRSKGPLSNKEDIKDVLDRKLSFSDEEIEYLKKKNEFSSKRHKFLKFISRKLIRIKNEDTGKYVRFFYPYEIQIMDYQSYLNNLTGNESHAKYKDRQKQAARNRVLWFLDDKKGSKT